MNILLTDLYQLTMMQGLFERDLHRQRCVFDRFYRKNPFDGAYSVVAGLEHVINYLEDFRFTEEDIDYLRSLKIFKEPFLAYLENFRFTGDVYAIPEGTIVFPKEILLRVEAAKDECMLMETAISMFMNHESLIATKARRIRSVAGNDPLAEFGLRRAQGSSAAIYGARATIIGGFNGTSNVLAAKKFGLKPVGTMAHSWVMSFPTEIEAFRAYAEAYDETIVLLVDTYNTLKQGVPHAIEVFKEMKEARGGKMPQVYGIRLDSGDLAYLSIKAREMLDEAGFTDAIILASNDLDEYVIADLKRQGATINSWGVGTRVITAEGSSSLGGIYKLAGQWNDSGFVPKMKFSDNADKVTNPGRKKVIRFRWADSHKMIGDLIALEDENIDTTKSFTLYDHGHPLKRKRLEPGTYVVEELLQPIFKEGKCVYARPSLEEIVKHANEEADSLWSQYHRFMNPPEPRVYISKKLWDLRSELLAANEREWE